MTPDDRANMLRTYRLRFGTEAHLQRDVRAVLEAAGLAYAAEYPLSKADRIDFFLESCRLGIECKVDGSPGDVARQLARYADSDEIVGLVLVTRRHNHTFPAELRGKPLRVVWCGGSQL
jgi:hypothetical protein